MLNGQEKTGACAPIAPDPERIPILSAYCWVKPRISSAPLVAFRFSASLQTAPRIHFTAVSLLQNKQRPTGKLKQAKPIPTRNYSCRTRSRSRSPTRLCSRTPVYPTSYTSTSTLACPRVPLNLQPCHLRHAPPKRLHHPPELGVSHPATFFPIFNRNPQYSPHAPTSYPGQPPRTANPPLSVAQKFNSSSRLTPRNAGPRPATPGIPSYPHCLGTTIPWVDRIPPPRPSFSLFSTLYRLLRAIPLHQPE